MQCLIKHEIVTEILAYIHVHVYVQSYWFHSSLRIEDVQWVSLLLSVEREGREEGGREI